MKTCRAQRIRTVGAVYDRPRSRILNNVGGHRPPLQCGRAARDIILIAFVIGLLAASPISGYVTLQRLAKTGDIVQERWAANAFPIPWRLNPTRGANVTGTRTLAEVMRASFQ